MFLKQNYILNEGYDTLENLVYAASKSNLLINKKKNIDLSLCAGSLILGHNSKIFKKSIKDAINKNISNTASKNIHAHNFSLTLKKILPNYSKFIFTNSGTEAVFKALRIARAISKKDLIISVTGSWHGSVDELLYSPDNHFKNIPLSDGLTKYSKENIKFIPYNDAIKSKKILDKNLKEIACIIIEPIQGCLPIEAIEYLKFLDNYSKKNKIILIFDEIITGLRINGNTAQSHLKINPSISLFGKCFGGGLPIGIIALKQNIFNNIKEKNVKIFFGGTFSANAVTAYIANNITKYIIKNKVKIFRNLEKKSNYFQSELNNFFLQNKIDAKCYRYFSLLRIVFTKKNVFNRTQRDFLEKKNIKKIIKIRRFLFKKNIYYPTSGLIFIATTTSINQIKYIINQIKLAFKIL